MCWWSRGPGFSKHPAAGDDLHLTTSSPTMPSSNCSSSMMLKALRALLRCTSSCCSITPAAPRRGSTAPLRAFAETRWKSNPPACARLAHLPFRTEKAPRVGAAIILIALGVSYTAHRSKRGESEISIAYNAISFRPPLLRTQGQR